MSTKPSFNRHSTAFETVENVDLTGLNIVITGVTSGLGAESLRVLCGQGAHVIALARTLNAAKTACENVSGKMTPVACDLSDLASVAECAKTIEAMSIPIHRLMCNAGIMALPTLETIDGIEKQFYVNHLGHYLLIRRLLPQLEMAEQVRVVILSSMGHMNSVKGAIDFDNLNGQKGYDAWKFYGQSKLANILTAKALAKRYPANTMTANSVHPGIINTNLGRSMNGLISTFTGIFMKSFGRTIGQGAATQCYLIAHPEVAGINGEYFANCAISKPAKYTDDDALANKLWDVSEELVREHL
jgi:WW domain-containing oxidoreductase